MIHTLKKGDFFYENRVDNIPMPGAIFWRTRR